MSKKFISSKETYFKRDGAGTLADWEAFKALNPRPEYIGETCWALHDSMLARQKPAEDSIAVIKLLLKELNIDCKINRGKLEIKSDLAGQTILVLDIESDELLFQLEKAGANVIYLTSNVNYGFRVPERYFAIYPETYDVNDYPAIDKRNLFKGKNITVKYINFFDYKNKKLYNIIKEFNMKIDKVLMNPPYDGSLHLEVLDTTIKVCRETNPDCEIASVQPVRWLEDPLAEYKQGSDYKKYKDSIINKISKLQLIRMKDACEAFNIGINGDLAIYTFNNADSTNINIYCTLTKNIINKIITKLTNLPKLKSEYLPMECNVISGYRLRINPVTGQAAKNGDDITAMITPIRWCIFDKLYKNGINVETGKFWTDERKKSGNYKPDGSPLPYSIKLPDKYTEQELLNCAKSFGTNFIWNWIYLIKLDQNTPIRYIPYMEDYSKVWTDEDYCKFFDLNEEESKFMCRKVDDYRVKDFINYIKLEDEE